MLVVIQRNVGTGSKLHNKQRKYDTNSATTRIDLFGQYRSVV